jgi:hypothetical protein
MPLKGPFSRAERVEGIMAVSEPLGGRKERFKEFLALKFLILSAKLMETLSY